MEDLKTSLDKIVAKFNDSVNHSAPKKLNLDYLNDTVTLKRRREESTPSESTSSLNSSQTTEPASPWESRRIKADLIEARTRVSRLKQEIERQHKIRIEIETMYEKKVEELKKQCDFSGDKIQDTEKHMQVLRKREQGAKLELTKLQKEFADLQNNFEETIHGMQRAKAESEEDMRVAQNRMANELGEYRRHSDKLQMDLDVMTEELGNVKNQLHSYKERAALTEHLKFKSERDEQELASSRSRIKELENEIASYVDWKEIITNSQQRLLSMPEKDQEFDRLKVKNKQLQDLLGNKLLLEEQVNNLESRLEKETGARAELIAMKVKMGHMEQELKEWIMVAQDHCLPNMLVSPMALRSRIEQILQNDICISADKSSKLSESKTMECTLLDYKQKSEMYAKNVEEMNIALKRHKNLKERLQKKLLLVSKERDFYKQLSENFEKDLTISNQSTENCNRDAHLRYRIEMLEKTLGGYKDMNANLERELSVSKQLPNDDQLSIEQIVHAEGYDHIKRELDALRTENERLRRRKEELELELEQRCLKRDYDANNYKLVHLANNPAAEAYTNAENQVEKLQAEIERLKRRNKALEDENEFTQARLSETCNMTVNIKEINTLRGELDSAKTKMKHMKEIYKSASSNFREVCYMLFGYRIDCIGANTNYKLSSMFAESPDDYLNFRLNKSNVLDMLETPYSATLKPLIESQLIGNKSLPTFLSALTLELFENSTHTVQEID